MYTNHAFVRAIAVSALIITAPFSAAFAQDLKTVVDRLKALAAEQGVDITWNTVSGDPSEMTLHGVNIKPEGEKDALPIGTITLAGVSEDTGGYRVETMTTSPFSKSGDGLSVDVSSLVIHGLRIPASESTGPMASMMVNYETAELASLAVSVKGRSAFSLQQLAFTMKAPEAGHPMLFSGGAERFSADLTLIEDAQTKRFLEQMGYQQVNGSFEMAGSWQPADGLWSLSQYDVSINDAGTFGTSLKVGGLTPEVLKSIQEISRANVSEDQSGESQMAILALMQQVTLHGLTVRFDDSSLTARAIDLMAETQGQKPGDIVNLAKGTLPFAMMSLGSPEITADVSGAVNSYLDDPQSLEVAAEPSAPVPLALIAATAMSGSGDIATTASALWKMLGVSVRANQ